MCRHLSVGDTFDKLRFEPYRDLRVGNPSTQPRYLSDVYRKCGLGFSRNPGGISRTRLSTDSPCRTYIRRTLANNPHHPALWCIIAIPDVPQMLIFRQGGTFGDRERVRKTRLTKVTTTIGIMEWWWWWWWWWWWLGKAFDSSV